MKKSIVYPDNSLLYATALLDALEDQPVIILDKADIVLAWNKSCESIFNIPANKIINTHLFSFPDLKITKSQNISKSTTGNHTNFSLHDDRSHTNVVFNIKKLRDKYFACIGKIHKEIQSSDPSAITQIGDSEQETLITSEERLRLALDAGKMGVWDWDIINDVITWSDKVYELHGLTKDSFSGRFNDFVKVIHSSDSYKLYFLIKNAIKNVGRFKAEFRVIHPDNSERWLFTEALTLADKKGKAVRMLGATFDITRRKQAELNTKFLSKASKILSSSLDYQTTLNSVARLAVPQFGDWCSIDMLDENGNINLVAVAHKIPEKVKWARELRKLNPVDMTAEQGIAHVIKTGKSELYHRITDEILRISARNKAEYKLAKSIGFKSVIIVPLKGQGKTIGAITLVTTETNKLYTKSDLAFAEELASRASLAIDNSMLYSQVEQERQKFKALYSSNIIGVYIANKNRTIIEANEGFLKMLGYTTEEVVAHKLKWDQITPPEYSQKDKKAHKLLLSIGITPPREKEFLRKDGTKVWVIIGKVLLSKKTKQSLVFVLDITERKKLEERKDEFVGIASHELKTPLTAIKGYTQILERMFVNTDNIKARQLLSKTNIYINKLNNLIVDLLDVSKVQAGKLVLDKSVFDIYDLIKESIDNIKDTTKHKVIWENPIHQFIEADRGRMEQVMMNLLSNAAKYSPNADSVIIKSQYINNSLEIYVIDFGIGIAKRHHANLFERFYRVEKSSKDFSGLGIGLYITSEIVNRHGGKISVQSEEGKGSTFCIILPVDPNLTSQTI